MTRRDYALITQLLNIAKPSQASPSYIKALKFEDRALYKAGRLNAWENTCKTVADGLALNNPKFDKSMFLTGCGVISK